MAGRSFATMSWTEVVSKARSCDIFKETLMQAKSRLATMDEQSLLQPDFILEDLGEHTEVSATLVCSMIFMSAKEVEKAHNVPASALGLPLQDVMDEQGRTLQGFLLEDPAEKHRKVRVEVKQGLRLGKRLAEASDMLRADQTSDLFRWMVCETEKKKDKQWQQPVSQEQLERLLMEAKQRPRSGPEPSPQEVAPLSNPTSQQPKEAENSSGPGSPKVVSRVSGAHALKLLLGSKKLKGKGQGKGKTKGEEKKKKKGKKESSGGLSSRCGPPPYKKPRLSTAAVSTVAGSSVTGADADGKSNSGDSILTSVTRRLRGKGGQNSVESLNTQAVRYVTLLDAKEALQGLAMGNLRYNADRVLNALQAEGASNTSEYVRLAAQLRLRGQCQDLAASLCSLTAKERQELLESVTADVHELPVEFQVQLLAQLVRENPLAKQTDVDS